MLFETASLHNNTVAASHNKDSIHQKIIDDFDSSLILENIDKTAKNKAVQINLKINTLRKNLSKVTEQLELINLLNLDKDKSQKEKLTDIKSYLEFQIQNLEIERKNFGVIYSVSGFVEEKVDIDSIVSTLLKIRLFTQKYYRIIYNYLKSLNVQNSLFKW